jgi:hypothetical protein
VCGDKVTNPEHYQSKVAGEGATCAPGNGGELCGVDNGWTCTGGDWVKNCPSGWGCQHAPDNQTCYYNGQVLTCELCDDGNWAWLGSGGMRDGCTLRKHVKNQCG